MKYVIIILSIFLLVSCAQKENPETTRRIQSLEEEVRTLKVENANLKVENDLYKAWGMPGSIKSFSSNSWWPQNLDPNFVEWSYTGCLKEAFDAYVTQGSEYCKKVWYSPVDIAANKCQLDNTIMTQLKTTKSQAEWECNNLYK